MNQVKIAFPTKMSRATSLSLAQYELIWKLYFDAGYSGISSKPENSTLYDLVLRWAELPFHGQLATSYQLHLITGPSCSKSVSHDRKRAQSVQKAIRKQLFRCHRRELSKYCSPGPGYEKTVRSLSFAHLERELELLCQPLSCNPIENKELACLLAKYGSGTNNRPLLSGINRGYEALNLPVALTEQPNLCSDFRSHPYSADKEREYPTDKGSEYLADKGGEYSANNDQQSAENEQIYDTHHLDLNQIWIDNDDDEVVYLNVDIDDRMEFQANCRFRIYRSDEQGNKGTRLLANNSGKDNQEPVIKQHFRRPGEHYYLCYLEYYDQPKCLTVVVDGQLSCNRIINSDQLYPCRPARGRRFDSHFRLRNNRLILAQAVLRMFCWKYLRVPRLADHDLLIRDLSLEQIKSIYYAESVCDIMVEEDTSIVWETLVDNIGEVLFSRAIIDLPRHIDTDHLWLDQDHYHGPTTNSHLSTTDKAIHSLREWCLQDKDFALVLLSNCIRADGSVVIKRESPKVSARRKHMS